MYLWIKLYTFDVNIFLFSVSWFYFPLGQALVSVHCCCLFLKYILSLPVSQNTNNTNSQDSEFKKMFLLNFFPDLSHLFFNQSTTYVTYFLYHSLCVVNNEHKTTNVILWLYHTISQNWLALRHVTTSLSRNEICFVFLSYSVIPTVKRLCTD